jgi:hypothetical protein
VIAIELRQCSVGSASHREPVDVEQLVKDTMVYVRRSSATASPPLGGAITRWVRPGLLSEELDLWFRKLAIQFDGTPNVLVVRIEHHQTVSTTDNANKAFGYDCVRGCHSISEYWLMRFFSISRQPLALACFTLSKQVPVKRFQ